MMLAASYSHCMKTVTQVRHEKLLGLIAEIGSVQAFATKIDASHSQISQLKTQAKHSKTGRPRAIGDSMARKIEAAFGKPTGWMDSDDARPADSAGKYSLDRATPALTAEQEIPPRWPFPMIDRRRIDALPERLKGSLEVTLLESLERLEEISRKQREAA